jgi:DNA-binding transcriptional MerR regulator
VQTEQERYSAIQAARLSGCTSAQLDAWSRIGLVVPEPRRDGIATYSFRDLVALRMVASLIDSGIAMTRIRRAVRELVAAGEDIASLSLVSEGDTVLACRDDGQVLDALRHGQLALFVSVERLAHRVEADVRTFDDERRAFVAGLRSRSAHPAGSPRSGTRPRATGGTDREQPG